MQTIISEADALGVELKTFHINTMAWETDVVFIDKINKDFFFIYIWSVRRDKIVACTSSKISDRLLHRALMHPPEGMTVDHINGNRLDNTRKNLRIISNAYNCRNTGGKKTNKSFSKFKGVSWSKDRQKWVAQTMVNRRQIPLGRHLIEEDAARAYDSKVRELFGEIGTYNFPLEGERSAL